MFSTSRRTPRSQVSPVLPRISTDLTYTVWPVATLRTSTLMFRIRLLTFCTQHSAMRSAPSALPISISQPLQARSEEHTSELQSRLHLVCRLLLEKKKKKKNIHILINDKVYNVDRYFVH